MMDASGASETSSWSDAVLAGALFAIDPAAMGGVSVRAFPGPVRDEWLARLHSLLSPTAPLRRIPLHVTDGRLLGGLDLASTLNAGRPVAERGVLAEADGGVVLLAMAERLGASTAARIAVALDAGEVAMERDGVALRSPARLGAVLFDEGNSQDERPPQALLERIAFHLDLAEVSIRDSAQCFGYAREHVVDARERFDRVTADSRIVEALCATALALGIDSLRAPLLALRVARAAAALGGRDEVSDVDAAVAARLVLAPRATRLPSTEEAQDAQNDTADSHPEEEDRPGDASSNDSQREDEPLEDRVLEAARSAIPPGLLLQLQTGEGARSKSSGRAGALQHSAKRGRPVGTLRAVPRAGARLNVIETLRAAAPWQRLREREAQSRALIVANGMAPTKRRIHVRREDFHVNRFKERAETTTIFVVDASGSSALHRLAEAKGAVELLLADCYIRRDRVAVIGFRGRRAELLLPPTRSLVRAKRSLAGLPGGGGTPLASAIDAAVALADAARRRGETPTVVLLTDARANVSRDGTPGREQATREAFAAARLLRATGCSTLLIDTSPQPQPQARQFAQEMAARYLALPYADAATLSSAVQATLKVPASSLHANDR